MDEFDRVGLHQYEVLKANNIASFSANTQCSFHLALYAI